MLGRRGSWYFDGYKRVSEVRPNGKTRSRLVYVGEWYGFPGGPEEMRRRKIQMGFLSVVCIGCSLLAQFFPSIGGMVHWMAIPSLLSLAPMIFMVIGLINFLPAKKKWEIRVFYAGYRRLYRATVFALVLLGIWTLMELIFIFMYLSLFTEELFYFACCAVSTAAAAVQVFLMHRHPAIAIEGPKIE